MYWLKPFYSFRGRTNRARFWLVSIVCSVYSEAVMLMWDDYGIDDTLAGRAYLLGAALAAVFVPPLVSCVAVTVTRLHDRNKNAWWLIVFVVAPLALQTVAQLNTLDAAPMVIMMAAGGALTLWAFVELGVLRGTVGANAYGPDPLADIAD